MRLDLLEPELRSYSAGYHRAIPSKHQLAPQGPTPGPSKRKHVQHALPEQPSTSTRKVFRRNKYIAREREREDIKEDIKRSFKFQRFILPRCAWFPWHMPLPPVGKQRSPIHKANHWVLRPPQRLVQSHIPHWPHSSRFENCPASSAARDTNWPSASQACWLPRQWAHHAPRARAHSLWFAQCSKAQTNLLKTY